MSSGKIQTVRGDVSPKVLGRTLTHEHLCMKFTHFYREPPEEIEENFKDGFTCGKIGYIRQYPYSSRYNLLLNDSDARDAVLSDVHLYKSLGGVRGDVSPKVLGRTLTHEHLCMKFTHFYREPPEEIEENFKDGFTCGKIGYIRQYPYSSRYNLLLNDSDARDAVLSDVHLYKSLGGGTIVENSTLGLERDVGFYKQVSESTDVHIIAGTGHYIADLQSENTLRSSKEDLYNHMLKELTAGCVACPSVKAGFMGEIASVWPLRDFERKAIMAVGELQSQLGCGVSFHPHRDPEAPFEIIRLYAEAGGNVDKAVMSHLDRTLLDPAKLLQFSELGTYCQFDLFGTEVSYYQLNVDTDMPSDAQRIAMIKQLITEGKEDKILMSHDIHTKHRLTKFGGHGYSHIITNVLPRLKHRGVTQEVIDKITIHNPAKWLTIVIP